MRNFNSRLDLALIEIVRRLHAFIPGRPLARADLERRLQALRRDVRRAHRAHLALVDQVAVGAEDLFERRVGIVGVQKKMELSHITTISDHQLQRPGNMEKL